MGVMWIFGVVLLLLVEVVHFADSGRCYLVLPPGMIKGAFSSRPLRFYLRCHEVLVRRFFKLMDSQASPRAGAQQSLGADL